MIGVEKLMPRVQRVHIQGKVREENKKNVETMSEELKETVSRTLDVILTEYFSEKNTGNVA